MQPHPPPSVIVVAGPTASGKSALALELAAARGGTIINADSQQIYRDLPMPVVGVFTMPDNSRLGFEPDHDASREIAKPPLSHGRGKG